MGKRIENSELSIIQNGRRRRAIRCICDNCGKSFLKSKTQVKNKLEEEKYFCSNKCQGLYSRKRILIKCDKCGNKFELKKSQLKASKSELHFCSRKCKDEAQRTENSILKIKHYTNGSSIYQAIAYRNYGKICSNCGYDEFEEGLEVHHIDGNRNNNDLDNLIVLCGRCHNLITYKKFKIVNRELILI
jgi:hypothetical protein